MTGQAHEHSQPLVPLRLYVAVWAGLVALTCVTVGASYVNLGNAAVMAALLIAGLKSSLVILYFMHVRYEKAVVIYMIVAAIATYVVFIGLTFSDYYYR